MKPYATLFLLLTMAGFAGQLNTQAQTTVSELTGTWRCEAPKAPSGYTQSIMEITQDSIIVSFTGDPYSYSSTVIKFDSDTLVFIINELDAKCDVKVEDSSKMTGQAVWPDGQSTLVLRRIEDL